VEAMMTINGAIRFFKEAESNVNIGINGTIRVAGHGKLKRSSEFGQTRFVVRGDWSKDGVALVSGGGSGHEPGHVGFVGRGMLTAAVCGEVFASPSVEAVLACILSVTGDAGCLLIVKNYTGDRLNFGLAAERAKKLGYKVELLIVQDDVSIANNDRPRGIAGVVVAHKVAGSLAEQGVELAEIKSTTERIMQSVRTVGFAISTCTLPGQQYPEPRQTPEFGLGIHGEPGAQSVYLNSSTESTSTIIGKINELIEPDQEYGLLLNNLGAVTPLEMSIIADDLLRSSWGGQIKTIVGPQSMITALDMYGFSVTLFPYDRELMNYLKADTDALGWPGIEYVSAVETVDIGALPIRSSFEPSRNDQVEGVLKAVCSALLDSESELNEIDALVGDGDTGTTFGNAARAINQALEDNELPLNEISELLSAIAQILSNAMGGSSGVLLSILLTRFGSALEQGYSIPSSFMKGIEAVCEYGGATLGDRTMIDALIPAALAFEEHSFEAAVNAARKGADQTKDMLHAGAGRSAYLRKDSLKGTIDPGAEAIARIFYSISEKMSEHEQ
jgi:dihydroxyacetone kinase